MKARNWKSLSGLALAALLMIGCSGELPQQAAAPENPAVEAQPEAKQIQWGNDVAFFSWSNGVGVGDRLGTMLSDQRMDISSAYLMEGEFWEQASISKDGWIVQIGGRFGQGLDYRIGKLRTEAPGFEWRYRGTVTTLPVYYDDYDVSINDKNQVVFVWSTNNWTNAYYSSAYINESSGTGLSWNQKNVAIAAAGGQVHNPRISFGGPEGNVIGIIYRPYDVSHRMYGYGSFNAADGSVYWYLDHPNALTGRHSGDGIYDIAMASDYSFSLVWASNQGKNHYAYHLSGWLTGPILLANGAQTELCRAKDSGTWTYDYWDVEVGRSGQNLLVTLPQSNTLFQVSLGTYSAKCDGGGRLSSIHVDGRNVATSDADLIWPSGHSRSCIAHLAY